jgi:glycosyltransferase involved in cell wall biosynthesis
MATADGGTVHVFLPAYGPSPYLGLALDGVLAAADAATLVTVVDDGSPDDAVEVAARRAGNRVEYIRLDRNLGVAGAFQRCVDLTRGDYTVITGSDDVMAPGYVRVLRDLFGAFGGPSMVLPGVRVIDEAGMPVRPLSDWAKSVVAPRTSSGPRLLSGDRLAASLLLGNWLYFPAMAWRSDRLRSLRFRQDLTTALDLDLALRATFAGDSLAVSSEMCFAYRRHRTSVSSQEAAQGARFEEERAVHRWAASEARRRSWPRAYVAGLARATSRAHSAVVLVKGLRGETTG